MIEKKQDHLILQLQCKEYILKKLKDRDHDNDPEAGQFDQQLGASTSSPTPAHGKSSGKELIVYKDSTQVQPVNMLKVNTILFVDMNRILQSMVNVDEIQEGEFVVHGLTKEQIAILLNQNKDDVEELERHVDKEVEDVGDAKGDQGIPFGDTHNDDVEMEDIMAEEYPDMTQ